jgi:hypothetical protein
MIALSPSLHHSDALYACKILSFQMDSPKMILAPTDATMSLEMGENDEDVLNEVSE